mmetsp:Transcript_34540/g.108473  ORF Transcript_34540/g.108473 Transcript_34540/m.108473 type:complete len:82 (+) Transcript_34540:55-300(+)
MQVKVCLFASARERAGTSEERLDVDSGATTDDLRRLLADRFPGLADLLPGCALARNGDYVTGTEPMAEGDELAVLPPVSGG